MPDERCLACELGVPGGLPGPNDWLTFENEGSNPMTTETRSTELFKNQANCKTEIRTLRRGSRFRCVSGNTWTFDHWYKDQADAVVVKSEDGTKENYFAACALVETL